MIIVKPKVTRIRLRWQWDLHSPSIAGDEEGPEFEPLAYGHNVAFFCPTCCCIWAKSEEVPNERGHTFEVMKRGCSPEHNWHSEDHGGSLLMDTRFDLLTLGPEAFAREVKLTLGIPV